MSRDICPECGRSLKDVGYSSLRWLWGSEWTLHRIQGFKYCSKCKTLYKYKWDDEFRKMLWKKV